MTPGRPTRGRTIFVIGATLLGVAAAAPAKKPATTKHTMVAQHKVTPTKAPTKATRTVKPAQPK